MKVGMAVLMVDDDIAFLAGHIKILSRRGVSVQTLLMDGERLSFCLDKVLTLSR